jgi:hypothetical protein
VTDSNFSDEIRLQQATSDLAKRCRNETNDCSMLPNPVLGNMFHCSHGNMLRDYRTPSSAPPTVMCEEASNDRIITPNSPAQYGLISINCAALWPPNMARLQNSSNKSIMCFGRYLLRLRCICCVDIYGRSHSCRLNYESCICCSYFICTRKKLLWILAL